MLSATLPNVNLVCQETLLQTNIVYLTKGQHVIILATNLHLAIITLCMYNVIQILRYV